VYSAYIEGCGAMEELSITTPSCGAMEELSITTPTPS